MDCADNDRARSPRSVPPGEFWSGSWRLSLKALRSRNPVVALVFCIQDLSLPDSYGQDASCRPLDKPTYLCVVSTAAPVGVLIRAD
jgi:hypothetical protein